MHPSLVKRASLLGVLATLALAGTAGAVIGLPSDGSQVNDDPAAGIDPNQNAGVSDVVGAAGLERAVARGVPGGEERAEDRVGVVVPRGRQGHSTGSAAGCRSGIPAIVVDASA